MTAEILPTATDAADDHSARPSRYAAALAWWKAFQPNRDDGKPNPRADRGALARLRHASAVLDALDEEVVFDLHRRLGFGRSRVDLTLPPVAVVAATLAHIRKHIANRSPARAVGRETLADTNLQSAKMKPLRMQRLLQARSPDDVLRQMRRLVHLAGSELDVGALAVLVLDWLHPERGDTARTRFAYDYYAAGASTPQAIADPSQGDVP